MSGHAPGLVAQRTDVEPRLRTDNEKTELFPRLELLADYLYQTQTYILFALEKAGLTVVPLDPSAREIAPERLREAAPEQQAKIEALAQALEDFAALHGDCRCDECAAANKALRLAGRP